MIVAVIRHRDKIVPGARNPGGRRARDASDGICGIIGHKTGIPLLWLQHYSMFSAIVQRTIQFICREILVLLKQFSVPVILVKT